MWGFGVQGLVQIVWVVRVYMQGSKQLGAPDVWILKCIVAKRDLVRPPNRMSGASGCRLRRVWFLWESACRCSSQVIQL